MIQNRKTWPKRELMKRRRSTHNIAIGTPQSFLLHKRITSEALGERICPKFDRSDSKIIVLLVELFTITFFPAPRFAPKFLAELLFFISTDI